MQLGDAPRRRADDPAYNTIERDDFPVLLESDRYFARSTHFDEIIACTEEHFWNPDDADYIDFGAPWPADEPILPLTFIVELQTAVADRHAAAHRPRCRQRHDRARAPRRRRARALNDRTARGAGRWTARPACLDGASGARRAVLDRDNRGDA